MSKVTKKAIKGYVKDKLQNDPNWTLHALSKIYEFQTADEQVNEETNEENGIGFTGADGMILTSITKQYRSRGFISPKQMSIVTKKISKYWKQIITISDRKKLIKCMIKDGIVTEKDAFLDAICD